jgi:hypothetical protein
VLYFVDSITSFDDRMQSIAAGHGQTAASRGVDFGILGKDEKDSGHEVRRFGEEMLFQDLKAHNTEMIQGSGRQAHRHGRSACLQCPEKRLQGMPPVEHISQFLARQIRRRAQLQTDWKRPIRFTPITIRAIWAATTAFTTIRAR